MAPPSLNSQAVTCFTLRLEGLYTRDYKSVESLSVDLPGAEEVGRAHEELRGPIQCLGLFREGHTAHERGTLRVC